MKFMFMRFFAWLLTLVVFIPGGDISPIKKEDALKDSRLTFSVFADMHTEGFTKERFDILGNVFRDISESEIRNDAVIFAGDNTMNGQRLENLMFFGLEKRYNTAETVLMACGNHDICPGKHNRNTPYEKLEKRFIDFNNAFLDDKIEEMYHSKEINGYTFIILSSDKDAGINQYISEEQFSWLEGKLSEAEKTGRPVFLFSHWPLNHIFSEVWQEGHVGEQSERLLNMLESSGCRIFFFNGHLHMGMFENDYHIADMGQITYINVPGVGVDNNDGDADRQERGNGLFVEVGENEVSVRIRNFAKHQWTEFSYLFDIAY